MDLLEYQGKQLFAKHGVPVPDGPPRDHRRGGRRGGRGARLPGRDQGPGADRRPRQGGRHQARRRTATRPRSTPSAILGMDIRGFTVHELYVEKASDIDEEYYAAIVFDRARQEADGDALAHGRHGRRGDRREGPRARSSTLHVDPLIGFQDFHGRRLAFEAGIADDVIRPVGALLEQALRGLRRGGRDARRGQPAARDQRPRGGGARRQGHDRRQRALPPPRHRRAPRRVRRGPAGADGQGARPDLREARRQRRASSATAPGS